MRMRFAACLMALVSIFGACGGRLISTETDGQTGGSSSHGGSHASGATANTGATNSTGATGSYGATSSYAGSTSIAGMAAYAGSFIGTGGSTSSGCACAPLLCPPSYVPVPNPDGCCYHCESICNQMACPAIGCGSGSHLETVPGQCCPTCVQDGCDKQQALYQDFKKQLVEKYSTFGCKSANDCTIYWEKNQCGAGCGIAVPSAAVGNLDTNLQSFAQQTCGPNCPFQVLPCDAPAGPFCFNNRCQ